MNIQRDFYLNRLIFLINKKFIKIIVGIRRVWKSTLLELFHEYIKKHFPSSIIVHLNFDSNEDKYLLTVNEFKFFYLKNLSFLRWMFLFLFLLCLTRHHS